MMIKKKKKKEFQVHVSAGTLKKSHNCSLVLPVQQLCLLFRTDKTMTIFSELNPDLVCMGKTYRNETNY